MVPSYADGYILIVHGLIMMMMMMMTANYSLTFYDYKHFSNIYTGTRDDRYL